MRVANAEMAQAVRVVTVERGIDPRELALVAFGGAGPLHAAAIAEELGMERVVAPVVSGVLSALGLAVSERRRDLVESVLLAGEALTPEAVAEVVERLGERGRAELGGRRGAARHLRAPLRGAGVRAAGRGLPRPDPSALRSAFDGAHAERYGYDDAEAELELVTVRVAAALPGAEPEQVAAGGPAERRRSRRARFAGEWHNAEVLGPGSAEIEGPAIFELPGSTLVVPPGWSASADGERVVMER